MWRHNNHDSVSNHQPHSCLLNRLFRRRSKKTSKFRVTGLCVGNSPGSVNSPHKGPVTRKMFPFDDVIMLHYDSKTGRWIPLGNDWIFCVVVCPDQRSVGDTWIKLGLSYVTCCLSSVYNLVSMVIVHPGVTRRAMPTKIKHINTVRHFDAYIDVLTCYPNTFQNAVSKLSVSSFKIQYVPVLSSQGDHQK